MSLPQHIAIIPDGNRRWAKARSLNPWDGHTEGVKRFWDLAEHIVQLGVPHLTFWGSSYGNLTKRSALEVAFLVRLLEHELSRPEVANKLHDNQVRLRVAGEWRELLKNDKLSAVIDDIEQQTSDYENKELTILFGYDGQREMLNAINNLNGVHPVSEADLRGALWTNFLPDVDLVIRTGGEPHWSAGFLMWQTANSQFYFTEELWPDFKVPSLQNALDDYALRERRHGK